MSDRSENINKLRPTQFDKTPLVYDDNEGTTDGVKFDKLKSFDMKKFYVTVKCDDVRKEYDEWKDKTTELYKASRGKINMFKTGTIWATSLNLFFNSHKIKQLMVDIVEADEFVVIDNATRGALTYANKDYSGKGFKYDYKSFYPAIMVHHEFPIRKGKWKTYNDLPESLPYGLYHAYVKSSHWSFQSAKEWLTHSDIISAREVGKKVRLICDDEPNAYIYPQSSLISGEELFGDYVELLFNLKQKGCPDAKKLLNILWGALTKTKKVKYVLELADIEDRGQSSMTPRSDGRYDVVYDKDAFEFTFGRIKPFLLAFGRTRLRSKIWHQIDNVVWVHTDGFILNTFCKGTFKDTERLGALHYEGWNTNVQIEQINQKFAKDMWQKQLSKPMQIHPWYSKRNHTLNSKKAHNQTQPDM